MDSSFIKLDKRYYQSMSKPSSKYLSIVEKWIIGDLSIQHMNMTMPQKFRAQIAFEAYQLWTGNKQMRVSKVMRNLAKRNYEILLRKAEEGDAKAIEYVETIGIKPGVNRSATEISNDVYVLNWLIGRLNIDTTNIERAKVEDASDWLISEGMKMGDARAVKSGADLKMQLHKNFDEKENAADQMPNTDINITGDVSVIKSDRVNYTDEEKRKLMRKYGLAEKEIIDMQQDENGIWQMSDAGVEDDEEQDVFDENL